MTRFIAKHVKLRKLQSSIRAISPVIAVLLMIAITVVASLVAYAWVTGFIGGKTAQIGKAVQIQSVAKDSSGNLVVYVQNVGQGQVQFDQASCVYVNGELRSCTIDAGSNPLAEGQTATLTIAYVPPPGSIDVKIVAADGTSGQTTISHSVLATVPTPAPTPAPTPTPPEAVLGYNTLLPDVAHDSNAENVTVGMFVTTQKAGVINQVHWYGSIFTGDSVMGLGIYDTYSDGTIRNLLRSGNFTVHSYDTEYVVTFDNLTVTLGEKLYLAIFKDEVVGVNMHHTRVDAPLLVTMVDNKMFPSPFVIEYSEQAKVMLWAIIQDAEVSPTPTLTPTPTPTPSPTPSPMPSPTTTPVPTPGKIFSDGFESSTILTSDNPSGAWDGAYGAVDMSNVKHSGTYALQSSLTGTGSYGVVTKNLGGITEAYVRSYVMVSALPVVNNRLLAGTGFIQAWDQGVPYIFNEAGTLRWSINYHAPTTELFADSAAVTINTGQWYCQEIYVKLGAGTGEIKMWIDGIQVVSLTGLNNANDGSMYLTQIQAGAYSPNSLTANVYIDDVVISTSGIGP